MKTLIFVLSAAALVSSQYHHYHSLYPQHIPIIDHNGVPVDTPEVQAARASHLAALSAASHGHPSGHYTAPWIHHYGVPVIAPDGTPLDTPEVQHAKSAHFAAYNEAAVRNGVGHHGPIDTPEVQQAKAEHLAAYAQIANHGRYRRAIYYNYPYYPAIGHDGTPIETPEVQAAKAHHFNAHAAARYRNVIAPFDYSHEKYAAHVPLVPLDTPEVQHAKSVHFAAHDEALARNHYSEHDGAVVPVDTPEVQLAKLEHFAAHAAARSHY